MTDKTIYYTGLIAQVANQGKFLEFLDGMTVAYPEDYAMIQGAIGNAHAPNSGIRVSISSYSDGTATGRVNALVPTYVFDEIKQVCISNLGKTSLRSSELLSSLNAFNRLYSGINTLLKEVKSTLAGIVSGTAEPSSLMVGLGKAVKQTLLKVNGVTEDKSADTSVPHYGKIEAGANTDFNYYQVRVKAGKNSTGAPVPCNTISIKRASYITDDSGKETELRQPWNICISKFDAKPKMHANGTVAYDSSTITNKQDLKFTLTDDDMYRVAYSVEHFVAQWERAHLSEFMEGHAQTQQAKSDFYNNNG